MLLQSLRLTDLRLASGPVSESIVENVKTKAYKLASELGLQEQYVLEWLRANGYPNVRRGDTIRADVAQAARRTLSRKGPRRPRGGSRPPTPVPHDGRRPEPPPTKTGGGGGGGAGFRMSFADLLEQHLPGAGTSPRAGGGPRANLSPRANATPDISKTVEMPLQRPNPALLDAQLRSTRAEQARDGALHACRVAEQARDELRAALAAANARLGELSRTADLYATLQVEHQRVQLERSTLREQVRQTEDERATLEQTCSDLQVETVDLRETVVRVEREQADNQAMVADLQQAMQREMAWRARALELERAHQLGTNLPALLQGLGVTDFRGQAMVIRAVLNHRDTASAFLRSIRQVDAATIERLVRSRLAHVCAHPVCNQVAAIDDRAIIRVESAKHCDVCGDSEDHRWFARMSQECGRAGVRRLLLIGGGEAVQAKLRTLSQGRPVDLRLVGEQEHAQLARVRGRIEGCDILIVWSNWVVERGVSDPYAEVARAEGRSIVSVIGQTACIATMARAVCNRLARNHVLQAV